MLMPTAFAPLSIVSVYMGGGGGGVIISRDIDSTYKSDLYIRVDFILHRILIFITSTAHEPLILDNNLLQAQEIFPKKLCFSSST